MAADEVGSPPEYSAAQGVSIHDLLRVIKGSGTKLVTVTRPAGRIPLT